MSAAASAPLARLLAPDLVESEFLMSVIESTAFPVFVVGAADSPGSKVVDELLKRGRNVRALVRPASEAGWLGGRGVERLR